MIYIIPTSFKKQTSKRLKGAKYIVMEDDLTLGGGHTM